MKNGWTKLIITALISGGLWFFIGRETVNGKYQERIDGLVSWKDNHEKSVETKMREFEALKTDMATNIASIQKDIEYIKKSLEKRR